VPRLPSPPINIQHATWDKEPHHHRRRQRQSIMVCSKCQKLSKSTTTLATPGVKKKSEIYFGSPATTSSKAADKTKTSATLGNNGIGKVSTRICSFEADAD
jgi:hypothetical protein